MDRPRRKFARIAVAAALLCLALPAATQAAGIETFHDCEGICPQMAVLPPGSFMMGGKPGEENWSAMEAPRHRVTIPYSLAVAVTDVTFEQWSACASDGGCNGYTPADYGFGRGDRPVVAVSWNDAQSYVAWLSAKTGQHYRLLSEAEWEYAARAGTDTAYYWGDAVGSGNAVCNGCGSAFDKKSTAPVASFAPNAFGLHDMAGNVMQWTQDCWTPGYTSAPTDGSARTDGDCSFRVVRGGNWFIHPFALRSGFRRQIPTGERDDIFGFRVARLR